jgi:hypothetical protein
MLQLSSPGATALMGLVATFCLQLQTEGTEGPLCMQRGHTVRHPGFLAAASTVSIRP